MDLFNGTKLAMSAAQSLGPGGQPSLVVVAKATYAIPEGLDRPAQLAERQTGILRTDVFEGEPGLSSPLLESDQVPGKPACDVVVKGAAHAPMGKPVAELLAGITVGPVKKSVRVVGNRYWIRGATGWEASKPEPFVEMPLTYGRAFGGTLAGDGPDDLLVHPGNLVGRGFARGKHQQKLEGRPLPNLEAPGAPVTDPAKHYSPVSLGPLSRSWAPRLGYAGTHDQRWRDEIFPLPPPDFDERYYQSVPADQQMPYPRGGEEVSLLNLRRGGGLARFRLPPVDLPMVVLLRSRKRVPLVPVVDTLILDTDAGTFDMVWRARLPVRRGLHEIHTIAAGDVCKRWWHARVFGSEDCGCGGTETQPEDLAPVTEALD